MIKNNTKKYIGTYVYTNLSKMLDYFNTLINSQDPHKFNTSRQWLKCIKRLEKL